VVLPLLRAEDRAIMVGDHKQLGPVVTEHNLCKAYLVMLEKPMLERVVKKTGGNMPCNTMLKEQYRMHNTICSFPSRHFYESELVSVGDLQLAPTVESVWPRPLDRVVWIDCQHPHRMGQVTQVGQARSLTTSVLENNTSLVNVGEAHLVAEAYLRLRRSGCAAKDVAVITPYKAQQHYIQQKLKELPGEMGKHACQTTVGTVFSMQGSERQFVLLSFVRSTAEGRASQCMPMVAAATDVCIAVSENNPGLRQTFESHVGIAAKATLMNVALTRAQSGLVVVGNRTILAEGSDDFFQLATDLKRRQCLLSEECWRSLC